MDFTTQVQRLKIIMKLSNFDYTLPKDLIAQYPSKVRGDDRLLIVNRKENTFQEKRFAEIDNYFKKGDLLVLNNTKVIPARIFGKRKTGGKVEVFIVDKTKKPIEVLLRPSARIKENEKILLESGDEAKILGRTEIGRFVEFSKDLSKILGECGHVPLPPYIERGDEPEDRRRYQTVYAEREGATASPTAGLHFTKETLDKLKKKGVEVAYITLHVSYGTFAPVKEENIENHKMHSEFYHISKEDVIIINKARNNKSRIFSCGTTSLRTLETCADNFIQSAHAYEETHFKEFEGFTKLFIYPGYKFKMVDALITNFHLPKSTLLLLTSAFAGKDLLFKAYDYAIKNKFRFFSYGDAMLII